MRMTRFFVMACMLAWMAIPVTVAADYPAAIHYRQTLTGILHESQLGLGLWPEEQPDVRRHLGQIAVSADGTKVAFFVWASWYSTFWHLYTVDSDGSHLVDLTPNMPESWSVYLDINDDGSRVFFGRSQLSYCETLSQQCYPALDGATYDEDFRQPFSIDRRGDKLFFKHNAGWDEAAQKHQKGVYTASLGGAPRQLLHIDRLPCDSECGNMNLLSFLGASADGNSVLIGWNRDYWGGDANGIWHIDSGGSPRLLGNEHKYIWTDHGAISRMLSQDGHIALYEYREEKTRLAAYDLDTDTEIFIAETGDLNGYNNLSISPAGTYAFLRGDAHDGTRVNLTSGAKRDTNSYFINNDHEANHSNLTADDRYYFMGKGGRYTDTRLMRVDMAPTDYPSAPEVVAVNFSAPALLDAEGAMVGVQVQVRDAQGLDTIDWVNFSTLVDGKETPDWPMGRGPLVFPSGDPSSTRLFDDGSHGDAVAGDGIYSFDAIATRKGDREGDSAWNTWYQHHSLPHAVEIRLIVKDEDDNYSITDTELLITDNPADIPPQTPASVGEDWSLHIEPLEIFGDFLAVDLAFYIHPDDPGGLYWKLLHYAPSALQVPDGARLRSDFGVELYPVEAFGALYDADLVFYPNPLDPGGLYWRLLGVAPR